MLSSAFLSVTFLLTKLTEYIPTLIMTHHAAWHMWRLSEAGDDNLGLACSDDGLLIGRTPLIEKRDGHFVVREQREIEQLLSRAYRSEISADRIMSGLATVARALNTNDQCLAHIAAVHLRVPDIPDRAARDVMEATDVLIKYARDEGRGDGGNWNPALHPRTGTPPNPGWFSPTEDSGESSSFRTAQNDNTTRRSDASQSANDDWVRLPEGPKRIDELADFIEWIANAKPEDEEAIGAEIDRYFKDVGWESAAKDLKNMLAVLVRPGITTADRQKYLNRLDGYTRADPAEQARNLGIGTVFATAAGSIPPVASETRTVEAAAADAAAAERTAAEARAAATDAPSEVWKYGWARRGREIHDQLGDGSLLPNFPTIDMIGAGVATSIKSIALNAATYQDAARLTYRLNKYVDDLAEFNGATWATDVVKGSDVTNRTLNLVIPKGSMTTVQREAIEAARRNALSRNRNPVDIIVTPF
jgi:hypothetical protein